jgi:hypothetical protein
VAIDAQRLNGLISDPSLLMCALAVIVLPSVWLADAVHGLQALRNFGSAATTILIVFLPSNTA